MPDERRTAANTPPEAPDDDQRLYVHYAADALMPEAEGVADVLADLRAQAAEVRRLRASGQAGGAYVIPADTPTMITPPVGSPEAAAYLADGLVVERLRLRRRPDGTLEVLGTAPDGGQKEGGS